MTSLLWTFDKILRFRCPAQSAWSPDGACLAFVWQGAGEDQVCLAMADGSEIMHSLSSDESFAAKMWGSVQSEYVWCPDSRAVLRVADGIWQHDLHTGEGRQLTAGHQPQSHPSWSPDGRRFAFRLGNQVAFYEMATAEIISAAVPGTVYAFAPHLAWSPDGKCVAVAFRRTNADGSSLSRGLDVAVLSPQHGVIWETNIEGTVANPQWVDGEHLIITRYNLTHTQVEVVLVHWPTDTERVLWIEQEPQGLQSDFVEGLGTRGPLLSPLRNQAVLIRPAEGWDHLHLLDLVSGALRQITFGECEDSSARWSPDGQRIAYLSNGHPSLSSLDIWVWDKSAHASRSLISMPGAKDELAWSPDGCSLSYLHGGPGEPPGLWRTCLRDQKTKRLTPPWPKDSAWCGDVLPHQVWIEATDGHPTPGLLYTRPELRGRPAIIWLHGGPGMQYCLGWPTDYGGCIHHAFHQLLVQEGYTVLELNYRGSTGYGAHHQQGNHLGIGVVEPADVAGAAHFLSSLPQVDGQRLCVAGRSYGGFAALSALARLPGLFRLGIVIAGFGDLTSSLNETGLNFWDDTTLFRWRIGWSAEHNPAAWNAANILPDLEQLQAPLVIFHGVQDQAVHVEEAHKIERRCRELGKRCFAHYYAGEDHVFSSAATWQDVFTRTLTYLHDL